jgi:hypothetical protein
MTTTSTLMGISTSMLAMFTTGKPTNLDDVPNVLLEKN